MRITAIVSLYNNERTIGHVLRTLRKCAGITEIIAVDDGSSDRSLSILQSFKGNITILHNPINLGKGGAVVRALRQATGEAILLCDADLAALTPSHIRNLLRTFSRGNADMVLAAREHTRGWRKLMAPLTGERIFWKSALEPYLPLCSTSRFGLETIINFAHRGKRVEVIVSEDIGHIMKYERQRKLAAMVEYCRAGYDLMSAALHCWAFAMKRRHEQ